MRTIDEALAQIIYDDKHADWLREAAETMRKAGKSSEDSFTARELRLPMECMMQDTEQHTIWLLLVGKFGEWAQCINYGWIDRENLTPCAEYIEGLIKEET